MLITWARGGQLGKRGKGYQVNAEVLFLDDTTQHDSMATNPVHNFAQCDVSDTVQWFR